MMAGMGGRGWNDNGFACLWRSLLRSAGKVQALQINAGLLNRERIDKLPFPPFPIP